MGLLKCLSPRASNSKEGTLRCELQQVKAQLAEAKITIADLKQGAAIDGRISTSITPSTCSVAVQAKPPVECESRIPRPDEVPAVKSTGTGPTPRVSVNDVSIGTSAAPNSREPPVSPGALRSPKGGFASPTRGLFKSRIPPSPSPEGPRRSHSLRQSGVSTASAAPSTAGVVGAPITLAAALEAAEGGSNLEAVPNSHSSSDAGAGALAESSSQARADFLANQLKIADAFRQSLESELRDLRFKNAGLQTQVLTLQTKLEKAMQAQVDELDKIEKLRKGGGSADNKDYEAALAELAALKRKLQEIEADKTVAEQQAKAATEMASSHQMQLSATIAELSCVKADLATAQARVLELTAEGARLKQQAHKLNKAAARVEELEVALAAAKDAAAEAEAAHKDKLTKLDEELRTSKAISESTCEELLALSAAHSELKQAYFKMEAESKQHDQLVHIVQQELAEMSYFAAAGRVALGLCNAQDAPMIHGAVLVTPTHSGTVSPQLMSGFSQAAGYAAREQDEATEHLQAPSSSNGRGNINLGTQRSNKLVEDTTAVCIAAAAAAGAAAAIAANPVSPKASSPAAAAGAAAAACDKPGSNSSSRSVTPRVTPRMLKPATEQLATLAAAPAAAPAAAAARQAARASRDSSAGHAAEAACIAAALAAAQVALDDIDKTTVQDTTAAGDEGSCGGVDITAANSPGRVSTAGRISQEEGEGEEVCSPLQGEGGEEGSSAQGHKHSRRAERRRRRKAEHKRKE